MKLYPFTSFPNFPATVLSTAAALLLAASLQAQTTVRYDTQPGSKVKIEGSSSIHDWTAEATIFKGTMELDPAFDADLKTLKSAPKVEVTIPVRQLKSNWGAAMNNVMYDHLNMATNPAIKYKILNLTAKAGAASQFDAEGALTVAGITQTNTMPVTFQRIDKTKLKVVGTTTVKMSDFKIEPPTIPLLGIKTDQNVKISIDCLFAQPEKAQ